MVSLLEVYGDISNFERDCYCLPLSALRTKLSDLESKSNLPQTF